MFTPIKSVNRLVLQDAVGVGSAASFSFLLDPGIKKSK